MNVPEDWELQLAALLRTTDLSSVVESIDPPFGAQRAPSGTNSSSPRNFRYSTSDGASSGDSDREPRRKAIWKATKESVQVISYEMDADGARKCIREAIFLKRPVVLAQPTIYRALSHIVQPLGVWTSNNSPLLHLVLKQSGISTLAKVLECNLPMPVDLLRTILRGVLTGLDLCHQNGFAHCAVHPDAIYIHTCAAKEEDGGLCNDNCDYDFSNRRQFPVSPVVAQVSRFENSIEFVPNLSDLSHLPNLHKKMPAFWTAPELCSLVAKPKAKVRRRTVRESGGKVDIWSIGILTLTLIERNMVLSNIAPRSRDTLSTLALRDLSPKQVGRLTMSPKILQQRKWTTLAQDFVTSCLRIEPSTRPSAAFLLKHPFLTNQHETCLLSYSDVSESEVSPLEDTYEDSTTYIPAPDSDSLGHSGEESWSDDEDRPPSGRSNATSNASAYGGGRLSCDDPDYHYRTGSFQPSIEDQLGSSEASDSGGSVVIIDSDDSLGDKSPPNSAKGVRKRGKSDAAEKEMVSGSEFWLKPLDFGNLEVRTRSSTVSNASGTSYSRMPKGTPRRNTEFLRTTSASAIGSPREPDSPPGASHALIAVHTHKQPALKGSHDSSDKASRRFQSLLTSGGGQGGGSGVNPLGTTFMPRDSLPNSPTALGNSATTAAAASSASLAGGTSAGSGGSGRGGPPSRDRTPSPAKHAINMPLSPGRRSSLPLLPLTALGLPINSKDAITSSAYIPGTPASSVTSTSKIHGHVSQNSHGSYGSNKDALTLSTSSSAHAITPSTSQTQLSAANSASGTVVQSPSMPSVYFSPTSSSSSGSASSPHTPPPSSPHLSSPHSASGSFSSSSHHVTSAPSTKAATMSEKEGFRPVLLSKTMRSRSEDILIDKDALHQLQVLSGMGSPSGAGMGRSPSGSMISSAAASSSPTSPPTPHAKDVLKKRKLKKRSTDHSGRDTAPVINSNDEAFDKDLADCEAKWMQEIKKRGKALEAKEKELADKAATKLRAVRKRYDSQILAISKRDETRYTDLKHRTDEEKTKLMAERQRELDKTDSVSVSGSSSSPSNRRNSFSGIASSFVFKKPQFPKRVLHINFEKSVYEMDRRHVMERQEIELRTLDDTSLIEREFELQKFLVEQTQLEMLQELQRQHMEDVHSLKLKMNEELKVMTRKHVARKTRKLTEAQSKPLSDDLPPSFSDAAWQSILSTAVSPRPSAADPLGAALSLIDVSIDQLAPPAELTSGISERFHRTVELQGWRQDEEVQSLSRDIRLVEEQRREMEAVNKRQQQDILDLKTGFETHYIRTRQSFMTARINRVNQHELELADLKYHHLRRMISKTDEQESKAAEAQLAAQHDADYAVVNQLFTTKRQQLATAVSTLLPKGMTGSPSLGQIQPSGLPMVPSTSVTSFSVPDLAATDVSESPASPHNSEPGSL